MVSNKSFTNSEYSFLNSSILYLLSTKSFNGQLKIKLNSFIFLLCLFSFTRSLLFTVLS